MRVWVLVPLLSLLLQAKAEEDMLNYRVRGYIEFRSLVGGSSTCNETALAACAKQGRLGLRSSPTSLKVLPPPTGFAVLNNKLIDCPEGIGDIISDASGNNQQASGTFPVDSVNPTLVPAVPFVVTPGGNPNSIQIRTMGSAQCIYDFQLMQATNYILGVQPVEWISIWAAASARMVSPAVMLTCSLAAVIAAAWSLQE